MSQHILVVDDSPENRMIVKTCLLAEGFSVSELASGEELLSLGSHVRQFDLILLDVMMPSLNGYETCKLLKQDTGNTDIPVIFLSAESDEASRVSGFEAGGVDYVLKPFSRKELGMRIKAHLALSGKFQAVQSEKNKLSKSLKESAHTQVSFLPSQNFEHQDLTLFWHYRPVEHIAGDMFGYVHFDDGSLGVYLLDVCGHGPSAALVASAVHGALMSNKDLTGTLLSGQYYPTDPKEVIRKMNLEFPFERFERYFTFLYALIQPKTQTLIVASAGHPAPFLYQPSSEQYEKIPIVGKILGLDKKDTWGQYVTKIEDGSKLLLVSDGVLETKNRKNEVFESIFHSVLATHAKESTEVIVTNIVEANQVFSDNIPLQDDITVLCVSYK